MKKDTPVRLVIGAGNYKHDLWHISDLNNLDITREDHWRRTFLPESIDIILAEHVLEHLDESDLIRAFQNIYCFLKKGGCFRLAVPDGYHPSPQYIEYVRPGGSGAGSDDHKFLFNHETLSSYLVAQGFDVKLLEYFDEFGQFNAVDWNENEGMVLRSKRFDPRNKNGELNYTSIIIDAIKPI